MSKHTDPHTAKNDSGRVINFLKIISFDIFAAIPFFFIFVLLLKTAGYDLLELHPDNVLPPIPVYLADYSLTFTTKLLIGSVTKLFAEKITLDQMYTVCGIANITAVGILSLFTSELLRVILKKKKYAAVFIFGLLALNAILPEQYYPSIGGYNTYWTVLFFILIFLCCSRSYFFLAPVLCVLGVLVHDGFIFAFLPAVMVLLVYLFCFAEDKKTKTLSAASFGVTGVSCASLFVYSSFFQNSHLSMTADEFYEYMLSRFDIPIETTIQLKHIHGGRVFPFSFFETYFYDIYSTPGQKGNMSVGTYISLFHEYLKETLSPKYYISYIALLIPFAVLFAVLWGACAKKNRGIKKLPFIFAACIQAVIFPISIISTDFHRWIPAVMLSQLALFYAMLRKDDRTVSEVLDSPVLKTKKVKILMIVGAVLYLTVLAVFCTDLPMMDDVM